MKKLNDEFDEFRDCLRLVWNYALRRRPNAENSYADVSPALLKALVLESLQNPEDERAERTSDDCIPALGVAIAQEAPDVMLPRETDSEIIWERVDPASVPAGTLFHYVDVFDFTDLEAMHYYDYVKAVATSTTANVDAGATVALRRSDVDIVDLTA